MARKTEMVHTTILTILSVAVAALLGWAIWSGLDFYTTPYADRPHHEDFRAFRPAGRIGHGLGILGSLMVTLLLVYSLRKRMKFMRRWGNLSVWLRYHIFLGVAGPLLITMHTSFKVEGLVAASYWSMVAVALSGVVGRYLYQQIPRNLLGEALTIDQIESEGEALLVELTGPFRWDEAAIDHLETIALGPFQNRSAPVGLLLLPWANLVLARRLRNKSDSNGFRGGKRALDLARKWALQVRRLHLFHQVRDLFHYWHVFHKPFAIIMILIMIVHVAVAVALGYTWEFGEQG